MINLLLKFDFFYLSMKHIQSNEPYIHDVFNFCRTISSVWKLSNVKMKHCGLVPLLQSEAGACDQETFVENSVSHDR